MCVSIVTYKTPLCLVLLFVRSMEMEGLENNNDSTHNIAKGKRTKRLRLLSPCGVSAAATTVMMTSSCSSANSGGSFSSTTVTYESSDQEDQDMANCLILLAQGGGRGGESHHHRRHLLHHHQEHHHHDHDHVDVVAVGNKTEKRNRTFGELATVTTASNTKVGFYIYECKTCNRTFPSFQALGGHRASHKKPKLVPEEKKPPPPSLPSSQLPHMIVANYDRCEETNIKTGTPISLQLETHRAFHGNNKTKIHECSICGSEFTSGQALGGHMRRHRASTNPNTAIDANSHTVLTASVTTSTVDVQPRNILQLDLNLPAPEDDLREAKFQFPATQKSMVLGGAPALVDCHY